MILFLHHAYRSPGGEERTIEDLRWLVRERLGEDAELLERDSRMTSRARATAGLLRGGLEPEEVSRAVRLTGARVLHAHNLHPTWGWRALRAAQAAGARTVLHLHNYRLVCAVATCFTRGEDCTRCHGRDTRPGLRLACRGSHAEAAVYAAGLALAERRLLAAADVLAVPSPAALERLRLLGAGLPEERVRVVPGLVRAFAQRSRAGTGQYAFVAGRLAPEKGVADAAAACRAAGLRLRVAGDGPERARIAAAAPEAELLGHLGRDALGRELAGAGVALFPSRAAETFGLAAAEAMAAGVPVVGTRVGALPDLLEEEDLVPPGDVAALAAAARRRYRDAPAGERAIERARAVAGPDRAEAVLRALYAAALGEG